MAVGVVFPGQGTQAPGMGEPWVGHDAWQVVERVEALTDVPLRHLVTAAGPEELASTEAAQLTVFAVSLAAWHAVRDLLDPPVSFAGHSLGQLTALVASGALDFEDGVRVARARARLTQEAAEARPGRMVALLGAEHDAAREACASVPDCWIANLNAPGQIVVGGTPEGVDALTQAARDHGIRKIRPLDVGGAFHTPLMAEAAARLGEILASVDFAEPSAPVVCNTDATPHSRAPWRERLVTHLVSPVRWHDSMQRMVALGADRFVEVGHGSMLAGLARRSVPGVPVDPVGAPDDLAAVPA